MSENKNIDDMLSELDAYLEVNENPPPLDIEKIAKEYHEKRLREQKGNAYTISAGVFLGLSGILASTEIYLRLHYALYALISFIIYWINRRYKRVIEAQNRAISFQEFQQVRQELARGSLKIFKAVRLSLYTAFASSFGINIYDSLIKKSDPVSFIIILVIMILAAIYSYRAISSGIKEYSEIAKI